MQEFKRFADLKFVGAAGDDVPFINSTSLTSVSRLKTKYGKLPPINHLQTILKDYVRSSRIYYSLKAKTIKSFNSLKRLLEISLNRYFRSVRSMSILNMRNLLVSKRGEFSENEMRSLQKALTENNHDTFVRVYRRYLKRISYNNENLYKQSVYDTKYNSLMFLKKNIALIIVKYFCNYANYIFKASEELLHKFSNNYLSYLANISLVVRNVADEFIAKHELNGYHPMITSSDPLTFLIIISNDGSVFFDDVYQIWKQWMKLAYPNVENPHIDQRLLVSIKEWHADILEDDLLMKRETLQDVQSRIRDMQYIKDRRENLKEWNNDLETFRDMYNQGTINIERMKLFLSDVLQEDFEDLEIQKRDTESYTNYKRRRLEAYFPQMKDAIEEMENLFGRNI